MYPLIRRYLRRIDLFMLLLCAACSVLSVVVLMSIGQTQLGSNNKASVQLIASLLGMMLAAVFSTADYHALARAWPLHGVVAWGLVLPTLFLHNVNTGLLTIGYDAGGTSNYSWYRVGGMTFQPAELAKISFILTLALHLSRVRGQVNRPRNLLLVLLHILLPVAAIHIQGDDGTALVFLGIGFIMLYAGGLSHWLAAGGLAAGIVGGAALLALRPGLLKGYQFKRILAVLTPDDPALADITYQQNKGAMAIGTGGAGAVLRRAYLCAERMERFYLCVSCQCAGVPRRGGGAGAAAGALPAHAADRAALPRCAGLQYLCRHLCGAVSAVCYQSWHESAGAAGHRRDAAVLLGRRVERCHDVSLHRHCAERGHEHKAQQAGYAADYIRKAGAVRHPLLCYSAALGSGANKPGIRQSAAAPTTMNTVRDSQLILPPSSQPTALNPQMP